VRRRDVWVFAVGLIGVGISVTTLARLAVPFGPSPSPAVAAASPSPANLGHSANGEAPKYCVTFSTSVPIDESSRELQQRIGASNAEIEAETGKPVVGFVQRITEQHCFNTEEEREGFYKSRGLDTRSREVGGNER
jgi:hypothetical protein